MKTSDIDILLCAESRTIDDDHWVRRWSRNLKTGRLLEVATSKVTQQAFGGTCIVEAAGSATRPVLLVGYHLGIAAIAQAAGRLDTGIVKGAFLVAPPDLTLCSDAGDVQGSGQISNAALPFPSLMVASRSDPRCSFEKASEMALAWGSHLVDAGEIGQIDTSSGHGPWPEGLMRLGWFLKRL